MNPFSPEQVRRIAELGGFLRSVPKKAKKAELAQAMEKITEDDHQLLLDWMTYRLSRGLHQMAGISNPTGFVWREGQKPEGRG